MAGRVTATRQAILAVLVAATVLLTGCSSTSGSSTNDPQSDTGFVSGDGGLTRIPPAQRKASPELTGTTLTGQDWRLSDHKNTVVVINVWGSWCGPCRKEVTDLVAANAATKDKATFVGINTRDDSKDQSDAFVRAFKVNYPSIYDPSGAVLLGFSKILPPTAVPSTLIIDRQGRVAARVLGPITKASLVSLVDDTAAGK